MVRKCCVPGCTSSSRTPNHRLPSENEKALAWLKAIGLDNMIGAAMEEKAKLRICTLHFPNEMIVPYGQRRHLKDNAMPTLYLPNAIIAADCASTSSVGTDILENQENGDNFNFASTITTSKQMNINVHNVITPNVMHLRNKVKRYRKLLNKKRSAMQKMQRRQMRRKDPKTRHNVNLSIIQKTFLDMIHSNFFRAPQEKK